MKQTSLVRRRAGESPSCAKLHSTYEKRVTGRKCSSCVAAETTDKRRKIVEMQAEAGGLYGKDRSTRKREIQSRIAVLLSQRFLAEWPSFLEDMCGDDEVVAEDLYSIFSFQPLHSLYCKVERFLKLYLVHCLSDVIYSHPADSAGKRKSSSSVRLRLLEACNAILTHITEKYPVLDLYVNFAKKEQAAQPNVCSRKAH